MTSGVPDNPMSLNSKVRNRWTKHTEWNSSCPSVYPTIKNKEVREVND